MPTADAAARDRAASNQIRTTLVIARQAQKLSLTQLAEQVGCYANQINKWEQPDGPVPGIDWMARWAAALGYEIALLSKRVSTCSYGSSYDGDTLWLECDPCRKQNPQGDWLISSLEAGTDWDEITKRIATHENPGAVR